MINAYTSCMICFFCQQWGLYESAKKFVGWPIVPGFDVAGTVESVPENDNDASKYKW